MGSLASISMHHNTPAGGASYFGWARKLQQIAWCFWSIMPCGLTEAGCHVCIGLIIDKTPTKFPLFVGNNNNGLLWWRCASNREVELKANLQLLILSYYVIVAFSLHRLEVNLVRWYHLHCLGFLLGEKNCNCWCSVVYALDKNPPE